MKSRRTKHDYIKKIFTFEKEYEAENLYSWSAKDLQVYLKYLVMIRNIKEQLKEAKGIEIQELEQELKKKENSLQFFKNQSHQGWY